MSMFPNNERRGCNPMWSLCLYYSCCLMQQATKYKYKHKGSPAIKYNQRCRLANRNEYLHFIIFAIIIQEAPCRSVLIIMIRTHHQGHDLPAHILKRARICETHICIYVSYVNHKKSLRGSNGLRSRRMWETKTKGLHLFSLLGNLKMGLSSFLSLSVLT